LHIYRVETMSAKKDITAIVLNPKSRDGQAGDKWPWVEKILREHGIKFDKFETAGDENIVQTVKELAEAGYGRIVGGGGDGTQNAVINGIMKADVEKRPEYGILPFGTANDIGKSFNLSVPDWTEREIRMCARALVAGTRYNLDLGFVNGQRYFANSLTVGFDAVVLKDRNATRHARLMMSKGIESYVPSLFKSFLNKYKRPNSRVSVDGVEFKNMKLFNLVIKNSKVYAGNFILDESIRGNDGLLDAFLYSNAEAYTSEIGTQVLKKLLRLDPTGLSADLVDLAVQNGDHKKGRGVEIHIDRKIPSLIDGEEYREEDAFVVECVRHALQLIIPYEF
jgi:diacylglycerol kinase family enzyme